MFTSFGLILNSVLVLVLLVLVLLCAAKKEHMPDGHMR